MNRGRALRVSLVVPCTLLVLLLVVSGSTADTGTAAGNASSPTVPIAPPRVEEIGGSQGTDATTGTTRTVTGTGAVTGSSTSAQSVYVAEYELDTARAQRGAIVNQGFAAFIDGTVDALVTRTAAGSSLKGVAVAPDGSRVYMSDGDEPVLHVFDAETTRWILDIELPGVTLPDNAAMLKAAQDPSMKIPYSAMARCASGVASTPDGALVLVCSNAGLQVVDTATDQVVRTLSDLPGDCVAVSFDGKRAYVSSRDYRGLAPRSWSEWLELAAESQGARLVCIDLETWEIVKETAVSSVGSIAVKPDDSQVFFSESYEHRVCVADALTLEDLWSVSTDPSYALGLGFLPNGSKAYVVCSADVGALAYYSGQNTTVRAPTAEEYFCAVIDTASKEIVKRIPLQAY